MQSSSLVGNNRYKLITSLGHTDDYRFYAALDIETSQREEVLLNIYTGPEAIRKMVGFYYTLSPTAYPDYRGCFTEDGRFTAVFSLYKGGDFTEFFSPKAALERETRLDYAQSLLHGALVNAQLPPMMICQILQPDCLVVQPDNVCLRFNHFIRPVDCTEPPTSLLSPLVEAILRRPWSCCDEQIDFLDWLKESRIDTFSEIYSRWRETEAIVREDLRKERNFFSKLIRFSKRSLKRGAKKAKAKRDERRRQRRLELDGQ